MSNSSTRYFVYPTDLSNIDPNDIVEVDEAYLQDWPSEALAVEVTRARMDSAWKVAATQWYDNEGICELVVNNVNIAEALGMFAAAVLASGK